MMTFITIIRIIQSSILDFFVLLSIKVHYYTTSRINGPIMILKPCAFEQYTTMKTIDDDEPLRIHWKKKSFFLCGALNIL